MALIRLVLIALTSCLLALAAEAGAQEPPADAELQPIARLLADEDQNTIPDALNQRFRVRGQVSVRSAELQTQNFQLFIEDDSGGLALFAVGKPFADPPLGARVEASGRLDQFRGAPQLRVEQLTVLGEEPLPPARPIPLVEADSWQHYGRRVTVEGRAGPLLVEGLARMRLDGDDGSAVNVFFPRPTIERFDWKLFSRGSRLEVTGIASIYKENWPYDGGFQLVVSRPEDIRVLAPPMANWVRWGLWASLPAALLLAASLLGFALVQRRQRLRQHELATLGALSAALSQGDWDAGQLARRAAVTLTAYGVVEALCIRLLDGAGASAEPVVSADQPATQRRLEAQLAKAAPPADAADPRPGLEKLGLPSLFCETLPGEPAAAGWLCAPRLSRRKLNPMQQRTLLAATKLLALAIENRRIRQQAEAERLALHKLAATDDLTGLYNRRFLDEYLRVQLPLAARRGEGLAFIALDIDHFKTINDRYGHPFGDAVLRRVAATLRSTARESDLAVRLGGEEFLILSSERSSEGALQLGERLRAAVAALGFPELDVQPPLKISVSVGVALSGHHGTRAEELLKASDEALYAAKRGGRNRVLLAASAATSD